MELLNKYIINLNLKEAEALKMMLDSFSDKDAEELGLDHDDRNMLQELYVSLPFRKDN